MGHDIVAVLWRPIKDTVSAGCNLVNFRIKPVDKKEGFQSIRNRTVGTVGDPFRITTGEDTEGVGINGGNTIVGGTVKTVSARVHFKYCSGTVIGNENMVIGRIVSNPGRFI